MFPGHVAPLDHSQYARRNLGTVPGTSACQGILCMRRLPTPRAGRFKSVALYLDDLREIEKLFQSDGQVKVYADGYEMNRLMSWLECKAER